LKDPKVLVKRQLGVSTTGFFFPVDHLTGANSSFNLPSYKELNREILTPVLKVKDLTLITMPK
jgi:hypothetical protein